MKIQRLTIHNFRGIQDAKFALADYSLLVGPNNSGKSTIIDALRAFYEKDGFKFNPKRDAPLIQTSDNESWIEIEFNLSTEEFESLKDDYKGTNNQLTVRKYFRSQDSKQREGVVFAYTVHGILSEDQFYGAKSVQSGKLGDIVFIPAVSKVDEHTKLSGPSALRDLLTSVLGSVVDSSEAFNTFKDDFKNFARNIKAAETTDGRSLSGVETEINTRLDSWQTAFQLHLQAPSTTDIIKSMVQYEFVDKAYKQPQDIQQFGSGFQRSFIFSLIQVGAKVLGSKTNKKSKDFTPSMTLILFEEPEAVLHPPQQVSLAMDLRQIANAIDRQVLCSTHSPHFVSKHSDDIISLVKLKRTDGHVSVYQLSKERWQEIADSNLAINQIVEKYPRLKNRLKTDDSRPEMETIKNFIWLNSDRCGMFFADHVLLVEGQTEAALISRLIADDRLSDPSRGLFVLDCVGKWNIHRFMHLLSELGVSHAVIHDDDNGGEASDEFNDLIDKSRSPKHTTFIQHISNNLEKFLGITSTFPHRKPQHVLYKYATREIADDKLDAFCKLVRPCLCATSAAKENCNENIKSVPETAAIDNTAHIESKN